MDEKMFEHDFIVAIEMMKGKSFVDASRRASREMRVENGRNKQLNVRRISAEKQKHDSENDHDRICMDVRY